MHHRNRISGTVVRSGSKIFEGHPIVPSFTITHLRGQSGDGKSPVVDSFTAVGVGNTPVELAETFLTFISQGAVPYTGKELSTVTKIFAAIQNRRFKETGH